MKRRHALAPALIIASLCLGGCARLHDYSAVISGNRDSSRGLYQEAVASYLSVRPGVFRDVLRYDLANVYARLGEYPAAAELYAAVRRTGEASLVAAAWYNEGLALYEKGRYAEAWRAFRACLGIDPGDEDARHNLELSWRDWQRKAAAPPPAAAPSQRSDGADSRDELRLLRRFETGRYQPGARADSRPSPEDY